MSEKKADALALLEVAVQEHGSLQAVAEVLDVSRTALSLVRSDKYKGSPDLMHDRIIAKFGFGWHCTHTGERISPESCKSICTSEPPVQNPAAMRHYRTCQNCSKKFKDES